MEKREGRGYVDPRANRGSLEVKKGENLEKFRKEIANAPDDRLFQYDKETWEYHQVTTSTAGEGIVTAKEIRELDEFQNLEGLEV